MVIGDFYVRKILRAVLFLIVFRTVNRFSRGFVFRISGIRCIIKNTKSSIGLWMSFPTLSVSFPTGIYATEINAIGISKGLVSYKKGTPTYKILHPLVWMAAFF